MRAKLLALGITNIILCGMVEQALAYVNTPYIGVDIGAADLMDKESHSVNPESHQLGVIGPVAGVYLGYDFIIYSSFRSALEIFFDANDLQTQIVHDNNTYRMYQYYNTGIRWLPEYGFTNETSGHLILGYANGRFKIRDNGVYGLVSDSYNASGYQVGVGFDTQLQNHVFIRLDALYSAYGSQTKQGTGQGYTNRFSQLAGELSFYYKFAC